MHHKRLKGYIFISDVTKALEHEWFADFTNQNEFDFRFVLFNAKDSELCHYLKKSGFSCRNFSMPGKLSMPFLLIRFWFELLVVRPSFVHCHLFSASLIGLTAATLAGIKKRISTRHHSDFHHLYHPQAVKYDRWVNKLSTHIIAVSANVEQILREKEQVPASKITTITHGIPLEVMDAEIHPQRIHAIKEKYFPNQKGPVIGVISRFTAWKGVQYIIPAFKKLLQTRPDALLVLANADGNYTSTINQLLQELPGTSYVCIRFENDGQALMKSFDLFVHVPIDAHCEAFGQVYIEAMYLQTPMVCTLSGIATQLVKHNFNALVVEYQNSEDIAEKVLTLLNDEPLRKTLTKNAASTVRQLSFENKYIKTISLYR